MADRGCSLHARLRHALRRGACASLLAWPALSAGAARPDLVLAGAGLMHLRTPPRFAYGSVELETFPGGGWIGAWAALDGTPRDTFLGVGPLARIRLGRACTFMAGAGPGVCSDDAASKLGFRLQFRSSAYLGWTTAGGRYLGLAISHYSNGGMSKRNPGSEGVRLLVGFPLGRPRR